MTTGEAEERFWVRASADAPDKGPYTRAQLEQSHSKGLLKPTARVRPETALEGESKSLRDFCEEKAVKKAAMLNEWKRQDEERDIQRTRKSGNGRLWLGVAMLVAGIGLTLASQSAAETSGGGRYAVFTGLIVVGLINIVRGLIAR